MGMLQKAGADGHKIVLPAQHYIKTSLADILKELTDDIEDERNKIKLVDFAQRLGTLYSMRFATRHESLRNGFNLFCGESTKATEELMQNDDIKGTNLKMKEDEFIEDFHTTLAEGNFMLLSQEYYDTAVASDFEVPLNMEMDKNKLDTGFIQRLHRRHKADHEFKHAAAVTKTILIYHRGIGQATKKGWFVLEKIDILVSIIFEFMLNFLSVFTIIFSKLMKKKKSKKGKGKKTKGKGKVDGEKKVVMMSDDDGADDDDENDGGDDDDDVDVDDEENDDGDDDDDDDDDTDREDEKNVDRTVFRLTLETAVKTSWLNFFQEIELAEPTFRELIVVYRDKPPANAPPTSVPKITLKSFQNIPIADFEVVLPAQKPKERAFDTLKQLGAVAAGMFAVYKQMNTADAETQSFQEMVTSARQTLLVVSGYMMKIYLQRSASQRKYTQVITTYLYDKSMNNNQGLLPYIVDSTLQQEVKEAVIAYYFLWSNQAQTRDELDDVCEAFLAQIEESVDFEAEDGLGKLIIEDIVRSDQGSNEDSHLFHLTITRAIQTIQGKIAGFNEDTDRLCPFCPILGKGHK